MIWFLYLLFVGWLPLFSKTQFQIFKPVFHKVNDYDINGNSCSRYYENASISCPPLIVRATGSDSLSAVKNWKNICQQYHGTCAPNTYLDATGECVNCNVQLSHTNLNEPYCYDQNTNVIWDVATFSDEVECINYELKKSETDFYAPCHITSVEMPYYKADDFYGELRMEKCADYYGLSNMKTVSTSYGSPRIFDFPLVTTKRPNPIGFAACFKGQKAAYSYGTPGWIVFFSVFAVLSCSIFLHGITYILTTTKQYRSNSKNLENPSSMFIEIDDTNHVLETGDPNYKFFAYRKTILGTVAHISFKLLSYGLVFFLIWIILDVYGLHRFTVCQSHDIKVACENSIKRGIDPTIQSGYSCSSGCVFSWDFVGQAFDDWPFFAKSGTGRRIYITFIAIWHIAVAWWIVWKYFENQINSFFMLPCCPSVSTHVLCISDAEKPVEISENNRLLWDRIILQFEQLKVEIFGVRKIYEMCPVSKTDSGSYYFDLRCTRYVYNYKVSDFVPFCAKLDETFYNLMQMKEGLSAEEAEMKRENIGPNIIHIEIPSHLTSFKQEFFSFFYFYQYFCLLVWFVFNYWIMGILIFCLVTSSGLVKVYCKRSSLHQVKKISEHEGNEIIKRDGNWVEIPSSEIVPGDILKVQPRKMVSCDCALIQGKCVLDESSLTGEPTPVTKISLPDENKKLTYSPDQMKYCMLSGTYIQQVSTETSEVVAVVTNIGSATQKGKLLQSILFVQPMSFRFDKHWNMVFGILWIWGFIIMFACYYLINGLLTSWFYGIFTMSQIVSPLVPAVFTASEAKGASRLRKHSIFCVDLHRIILAGKVKYGCFDKTGTITEAGLHFSGFQGVDSNCSFVSNCGGVNEEPLPQAIKCLLGLCHEVEVLLEGNSEESNDEFQLFGNDVDMTIFEASGMSFDRSGTRISMQGINGETIVSYKVLRKFEFDRQSMTMGTIVECEQTNQRYFYLKGSAEAIATTVGRLPSDYSDVTNSLALQGYYVLAAAFSEYNGHEDVSTLKRESLSADLDFLGLIRFENCIKKDAVDTMNSLKKAAIRCIMITGDNCFTAAKIATECQMTDVDQFLLADVSVDDPDEVEWRILNTGKRVDIESMVDEVKQGKFEIAVNGSAWDALNRKVDGFENLSNLFPYCRIFSRMKPDKKVEVVQQSMLWGITSMCGDGANDAGALRAAHVGMALDAGCSDATIVAPFVTPQVELHSFIDVIRYGRCALAISVAAYKALLLYGEIMVSVSLIQYYLGTIPSEPFWIAWDGFVNVGMAWAILQSYPAKKLTPNRPTDTLLGVETFCSLFFQVLNNWFWLILAIVLLYHQNWFPCREFDAALVDPSKWWLKGDNFEASVISIIASFQFLNVGPIFNFGFDYRRPWWRNYTLLFLFLGGFIFFSVLTLGGVTSLSCLFHINCGDRSTLERFINIASGTLQGAYPYASQPLINLKAVDYVRMLGIKSSLVIPANAPEGCSCSSQISTDMGSFLMQVCESAYKSCPNPSFNSVYHHNIMPSKFIYILYGFCLANIISGVIVQKFGFEGIVRKYLRAYKKKKSQNTFKV